MTREQRTQYLIGLGVTEPELSHLLGMVDWSSSEDPPEQPEQSLPTTSAAPSQPRVP